MNVKDRVLNVGSEVISILIVEDEVLTALATSAMLSEFGYDVAGIAATADAALRLDAELRPDLVLMDVTLRGAVDGIDAARLLRRRSGVPILFATAHTDSDTVRRATAVNPVGYLAKPYSPQQLGTAVATACDAIRFRSAASASVKPWPSRIAGTG